MSLDPLRLLVPRIPLRTLGAICLTIAIGAVVAGVYGVLHDQVTYSLSEEYFTRFKFHQFAWAEPEWGGARVFAGIIGFLATWWVGALVAWVLARISLSREGTLAPSGELAVAFSIVFATSILAAVGGWLWGQWRIGTGHAAGWTSWMRSLGVEHPGEFMTVGYIHNASYLGGIVGAIFGIAYLAVKRGRRMAAGAPFRSTED